MKETVALVGVIQKREQKREPVKQNRHLQTPGVWQLPSSSAAAASEHIGHLILHAA